MNFLTGLLIFTLGAVANIVLDFILNKIEQERRGRKAWNERHTCNHCRTMFIHTKDELHYKFCPYCGSALTLHAAHPDFENNERSI